MGIWDAIKKVGSTVSSAADSPIARKFGRAATTTYSRPPMLRSRPVSTMNKYRPVSKSQLKYGGRRGVGRPKGPTGMYKDPKTGQPIMAYEYYAIQRKMNSPALQQQQQQQMPQQQVPQNPQQMQAQQRMQQLQQLPRMSNHQREMMMRRLEIQQRMQQTAQQQAPGVKIETDIMTGRPIIRQTPPKERWLQ